MGNNNYDVLMIIKKEKGDYNYGVSLFAPF